jgi:hypothetical protein
MLNKSFWSLALGKTIRKRDQGSDSESQSSELIDIQTVGITVVWVDRRLRLPIAKTKTNCAVEITRTTKFRNLVLSMAISWTFAISSCYAFDLLTHCRLRQGISWRTFELSLHAEENRVLKYFVGSESFLQSSASFKLIIWNTLFVTPYCHTISASTANLITG